MNYAVQNKLGLKPILHNTTRAQIASVGTYLPEQRVTSDDLMVEVKSDLNYGMPCDWMSREMGIIERRMASEELKPSDLAIRAATQALDSCDTHAAHEIDAVIFCGIERDQPEPATAHTIQNALGLNARHVFDVANACYGFVEGLKLATSLIESHMISSALVVTGEVSTRVLRAVVEMLKQGMPKEQAKHLWGMLSVGDAGGAVILGASNAGESGFHGFNQRCDSRQANRCHYNFRRDGSIDGQMQMAQIVARGFQLSKEMFDDTLEILGWDHLDWALSHQTGKRTFEQFCTLKSISEDNMVKTYPMLGNITTATFPVNFKKLQDSGNLSVGDRIGGVFAGSGLVTGQFGYVV